jgi:methylase of polypeptide subunit release factors
MQRPTSFEPVRAALAALAADPARFAALCTPGLAGLPVDEVDQQIVDGLLAGGIVEVRAGRVVPRLWIARRAGRAYYMSLQPPGERQPYMQDIWPESDALLARLAAAPPGSLLDLGTGSGVIAIEAALAGHRVTATDLYDEALELAGWNAALHDVELELVQGDLFAPLAGRRFDLVLAAPHVGGADDLQRVLVLRDGPAHVAPGGALYVATTLELEDERAGLVDALLAPMAAAGARVEVRPLPGATRKARWCTHPVPALPGLVARHRFTIELRPDGPAGLSFAMPAEDEREREAIVPLHRLLADRAAVRAGLDAHTAGAWDRRPAATVATAADLAALEALLAACARGVVVLDAPVPFMLHDGCRFGAGTCAGVYRGIIDSRGGVRPCAHGARVGTLADDPTGYARKMAALHDALEARRGCAGCPARAVCSQCTFPAILDEAAYCDLIRRHAGALPRLHQLLSLVVERFPESVGWPRLAVKLAAGAPLLLARRAPIVRDDGELAALRERLTAGAAALVVAGDTAWLDVALVPAPLDLTRAAGEVVELLWEGAARADLHAYAGGLGVDAATVESLIAFLGSWME